MKIFLIAFAVIVAASLAAIATVSISRSAKASASVHETRSVSGVRRIEISGQAAVVLVQGNDEGVTVDATASARVRTEVTDATLTIDVEHRRHMFGWFTGRSSERAVRIKVNLRDIDRIEVAGAVSIAADRLNSKDLFLDLSGACSLRVGDLQAATLKLDGSGATKVE